MARSRTTLLEASVVHFESEPLGVAQFTGTARPSGDTMKVHGSCHCKSVSYEAEVDRLRVAICHCSDCQALTGSAYRVSVPTSATEFFTVVHLRGRRSEYLRSQNWLSC
jgi:ribosomal protein L37AE/L43A